MFPNTNQNFTFNNFDKYIDDDELKETGIYVVKVKKGCKIEIVSNLDNPEGPTAYKSTPLRNFENYNTLKGFHEKLANSDDEFLYIGKTSSQRGIKHRLNTYKRFGKAQGNTKIPHEGGRRIWFIKNNKNNLVIDYISISSLKKKFEYIYKEAVKIKNGEKIVELIEDGLIYLHSISYDIPYPFANEENGKGGSTKEVWEKIWDNYLRLNYSDN
jgi:hypothetical protein